jgi:hypothetical protein
MCFALRERARLWPQGKANRGGKLHDYDDWGVTLPVTLAIRAIDG